ncbi:hypothetical protein P872_07205 [Rhodonellum psychrophilum GCM71 = DSM 17998]|uniref:Uncharacterized protein n=1 Tax=Rhodonellum psychrophilum GCM71 = DSM 17998 TaxID=1123057 RepID=U5C1X8_9BACT|nr:hypothetical protein P872_07205 [Rhodonellum psychrophilum GCM71 = DSM 17998]
MKGIKKITQNDNRIATISPPNHPFYYCKTQDQLDFFS